MEYIFIAFMFVSSFVLTFLVRKLAVKGDVFDIPNHRSSHSVPTPRGGGLAIALVWYVGLIILYFLGEIQDRLFFALLSGLSLSMISIIDDVRNISPRIRLLFQILSSALAIYFIGDIESFDLGLFSLSNQILLRIILFISILWSINLFNFLDGIDGYISTAGIFVAFAFYYFVQDSVSLLMIASIAGFLPWNWQRAKIFMGDVGSTLIGFNIAVLAIWYRNTDVLSFNTVLIITSLYWFDATVTLLRRLLKGERISEAHRKHAYQRVVQSGKSHQKTVIYVLIINVLLLLLVVLNMNYCKCYYLLMILNLAICSILYIYVEKKKKFE
jgi:Fuc2NAc and GlcNAc transferase